MGYEVPLDERKDSLDFSRFIGIKARTITEITLQITILHIIINV